uniref:Ion_trans domain-containing protein n=1 Tax=Mesocestoides corti TaxID=53468 RepID=A0A5K3FFQ8_MESCO
MIASVLCFCFSTSWIFRQNISNLIDDPLEICDDPARVTNSKVQKDCFTEPAPGLVILDMALNVVLTTEFLLKVLLAPDKHKFLTSIVSIIDMVNLVTYWIYISVFYFTYYHKKQGVTTLDLVRPPNNLWLLNILSMIQIMRILRIFKVSKISRGLRVLMLTVKKSIPELMLLAFLLMNGMFMFSCMIYMAEYSVNDTFADIPEAFWWSIITLTTVGYGDTYPKGTAGYIVGSMAAISGCVVTGLAIPIIGNNFNTYYMYMKNQLKEDKYLKELRRDINSVGGNNIMKGLGGFAEKTGIPMLHRKYRQFRADKQYAVSNRTVNSNAAKREEGRRRPRPMVSPIRKKNISENEPVSNLKKSLLSNSGSRLVEREANNFGDNTRTTTLERASPGESGDHRQSIGQSPDPVSDRRTSMLHPLATDGLLNLIPSSEIHTSGSIMRLEWEEPNEMELEELRYIRAALRNRGPTNPDRESSSSGHDQNPNGVPFSEFAASFNEQPTDTSFYATTDCTKLSPLAKNTGLKRNYV